jgi:phage shock protein C
MAGVIGGLAEYFNWDASLLRVITVILAVMTSVIPVLLIYIIWIFIVPSERDMK